MRNARYVRKRIFTYYVLELYAVTRYLMEHQKTSSLRPNFSFKKKSLIKRNTKEGKTFRFVFAGLFLGIVLIVINCYWIVSSENRVVWELTDFSIFPTVLFTLFTVAGVNLLLNRFLKNSSLSQTELATTYIMISIATALAGHDIIRQLVPLIGNAFWYATRIAVMEAAMGRVSAP